MTAILTNEQMRAADAHTIRDLGVPSLTLMERAGIALAEEAEKTCAEGEIVCVCGGGNNGGDGFVCARVLRERGRCVSVVCYAKKVSPDCQTNRQKWRECGGKIFKDIPKSCALIVDCLYGTGFHGALSGKDAQTVREINDRKKQGVKVLSADIPSGVNGDNGWTAGEAVSADKTLCIGEIKAGVLLGDGIDLAGEVKRVDIDIQLPEKTECYAHIIEEERAKALLPKRKRNSHKGSYGKAAIVAGSIEYTGAAYLAAAACLHSGAGYTTLFVPENILPFYILKAPEILLKSTNEGGRYAFTEEKLSEIAEYTSVAYGMGMGCTEEVAKGAAWLLTNYKGKLILDADGLNSLAIYKKKALFKLFKDKKCDVILTPHCKEFSRLSGNSVEDILMGGLFTPQEFAKKHGVSVLLKNAVSIITDGTHCAVNPFGCSGQAKGGSGDVLSGVIAGLCAVGLSAYEGGLLGAYLCGKAAELAAAKIGDYSLTASDVIEHLGAAFLQLTDNRIFG